jgi:ABC-2 type transport system permease protein
MGKFLAIVKHEYKKIVYRWTFLIGTLLFPVIGAGFAIVPAIIFSLNGEPTRLVVVDPTGKIAPRLQANLTQERLDEGARIAAEHSKDLSAPQDERMRNTSRQLATGFVVVPFNWAGKTDEYIRQELNAMASGDEIDAYLIVPKDLNDDGARFEFRSRKGGDFVASESLKEALNASVRSQRLADAHIDESLVEDLSRDVDLDAKALNEKGEEKDSDVLFIASLVIGMMIYITLTIYGQVIMGAVVEEKETRIAEILFSSARPFQLMAGKLVGVGLAGLTQLGIWVASLVAVIAFLSSQSDITDAGIALPHISPLMVVYFFVFFVVGYFLYASIFALIGSMVTTVQEGGQFAFPPIMIMLIGFYFCFAVIRDPNSTLSFWVSIAPLFAPLTMPVRILAETPPFWQIALAVGLNCLAIAVFVWLASRVYRVGMLMYGKRATIPEVLRWIHQR